jgi:hypothetical protein
MDVALSSAFAAQRGGMIAQYGNEIDSMAIKVEEVKSLGPLQYAASISVNGAIMRNPLYFIEESGELKFEGMQPRSKSVAPLATSAAVNTYTWTFGIHNYSASQQFAIAEDPGLCSGKTVIVPSNSWGNFALPAYQCTWFGTTCAIFKVGGYCDALLCANQIFGDDAWWDSSGTMRCYQPA